MSSVAPRGSEAQINPAAQITSRRTSPDDVQLRQIVVKLCRRRTHVRRHRQRFPSLPARHCLHVDNTWNWKTLDLDVAPGDHLKFLTINRAGRFTWFLIGTLGAGPMYVSIQPDP